MSDSTLIRRSAVLRRLNPPNQATHRKWRDVRKFQIYLVSLYFGLLQGYLTPYVPPS